MKLSAPQLRQMSKTQLMERFFDVSGDERPVATMTIAELPEAFFSLIVRQHNAKIAFMLERLPEELSEHRWDLEQLKIPTLAEFQNLLDDPEQRKQIRSEYRRGNFEQYRAWVLRQDPIATHFADVFREKRFPVYLPEKYRKRHVFCVGKSGSGKTETLKLLALSAKMGDKDSTVSNQQSEESIKSVKSKEDSAVSNQQSEEKSPINDPRTSVNRSCSFVLIDPHGDFALEMAEQKLYYADFREHPDDPDLIYIDPFLAVQQGKGSKHFPTMNPFDVWDKNYTDFELEKMAQQLSGVLQTLVSGNDQKMSVNMETLLIPCLTVLLKRRGSTLFDLLRFLRPEGNEDLLHQGKHSSNAGHRAFFSHSFLEKRFNPTKGALSTKIQSLLNNQAFAHFLAAPRSTIDLEAALNTGKSVIVNCASGKTGHLVMRAMGSFVVGMILGIAFNRAEKGNAPRIPIWLMIDEMQNFVSDEIKTILAEARKYALHMVLACQVVGQDMTPQLNKIVLGNTSVKLVGNAGADSQMAMSKEINAPLSEFADLEIGEFLVKFGASPAMKVKMRSDYVGKRSMMSQEEWQHLTAYQIDRYYREQEIAVHGTMDFSVSSEMEELERAALAEDIGNGNVPDDETNDSERKPKYGSESPFEGLELDV